MAAARRAGGRSKAVGGRGFRLAMMHAPVGMAVVTPKGRVRTANDALTALLHLPDVKGIRWTGLVHPDDRARDEALLREVRSGRRETFRSPTRLLRGDGGVVHADVSVVAARRSDGSVDYLIAQISDRTDEVALGERYRLIAENVSDVVAVGDNSGVLRWASPSITAALGWDPAQLEGRRFTDLVHPDDVATIPAAQAAVLSGHAAEMELRLVNRDGGYRWMTIRLRPLFGDDGSVVGRIAAWWDSEAHHAATEALEHTESRLRAALEAELDCHVFLEAVRDGEGRIVDLRYVDANGRACQYLGRARADLIGSRMLELFPGQRSSGMFARYARTVETGVPLELDDVAIQSEVQHEARYFDFRGVRVDDGLSLVWRDVTTRVATAEKLADSERQYRLLAENASDVVFQGDTDAVIRWVSPSSLEVLGYAPADLVGRRVTELLHPDDVAVMRAAISARSRVSYRARLRMTDDTWRWVEVTSKSIVDAAGTVVARVGSVRDVHAQVLAELALADAEERYRQIALNSSDVVTRLAVDGTVEWVFGSTEEMTGLPPEQLVGASTASLFVAGDLDAEAHVQALRRGETVRSLVRLRRADGGTHWVDVRTRAVLDDEGVAVCFISAWRDAQAEVEYRDALAVSEAQARDLAARYQEARDDAMAANLAKTAFLSRMSHELRTPLNAVLGFAQLLELDPLSAEQQEAVSQIRSGGRHLLELINEVLDIARIEAGRLSLSLESIDLVDVVTESLDLVRPLADAAGVDLRVDRDSCACTVWADRQRVIQVLLNLLSNGVKYNHPGGTVTVSCSAAGDAVAVMVADTGLGIAADRQHLLFHAFERLGADSTDVEGTGIGLALSRGLAVAMGGTLSADSEAGKGSTFTLTLRAAHESAGRDVIPPPVPVLVATGRPVRVLYVEDNPANARLMQRIADLRDNVVLTVVSEGGAGLGNALREPPDLVLLDLHLPDIPGEEVLRRLRDDPRTADIPVVVLTADATSTARRVSEGLGADGFLSKPVEVSDVLAWFDDPTSRGRDA